MKLTLTTLTLAAGLAALPLSAQDAPPPAAPPAPPPGAPPAPPPPGGPGLLPAPEAAPAEVPDGFKSEKERLSYALGSMLSAQEKNVASAGGTALPNVDDMVAGLNDVLSGNKSAGYGSGANFAVQIRRAEVEVDPEMLAQAVRETMTGQPPKLTPQQQQLVIQRMKTELQSRMEAKKKAESEKMLAVANEFLAGNAKAEGVKQTPGGLQYKIEKEGDGKSATEGDIVTINYKAMLVDGTEFEKNPATGPARKPVRTLPKGIQEGLTLIKTGGKATFWVPPALGFGENGRQPHVKSNAVLVYELELLAAEPLPKPPTAGTQPVRAPVTAVTPPITVEIPPKEETRPAPKPGAPPAPPPPSAPPGDKN